MKKYLSKIILIFALLFFVLAIVLFVQAVLGSILFDLTTPRRLSCWALSLRGLCCLRSGGSSTCWRRTENRTIFVKNIRRLVFLVANKSEMGYNGAKGGE